VVLDFSRHLDSVLDVDPDAETARAQAGVTLGRLNEVLADHGLKFAPDPAWGDKSVLGGAIGNNSTGSHSLQYGKTDAYIESCEVVLADGTRTTFGEVSVADLRERAAAYHEAHGGPPHESGGAGELEDRIYAAVARLIDDHTDAIDDAFPDLKRNVSGYNLDRLVEEAATGTVNLARLLAGSEGTLAIVTEATVSLEPVPETKAVALLAYETLQDAMADVPSILEHDPAAVEALDDVLLSLAGETEEFGALVADIVPAGASALLLVEFYAENTPQGKQLVADLLADRVGDVATVGVPQQGAEQLTAAPMHAIDGREAHEPAERERFWKLRKSGLPILLGRTSDAKHISFIEDMAVPPAQLPGFVDDLQAVLDEQDTFASFYAHAGPGCLHVRPLVNTKTVEGVDQMEAIADAATDVVIEHDGSVSGEHGDGRARTQWNKKLYGEDIWAEFRNLKCAFDPDWLLNPGQVCGDVSMTDNLRFDPDYALDTGFEPTLEWDNENGMAGMVELCHGCGGCRGQQDTTGGVMCPTYRASQEESTSTRGRANALRQAMSGDPPADPTSESFRTEVMDLCIGCKGCAKDCPSEVDMAKLKAEVEHAAHEQHGPSLRDRLFAHIDTVSRVGSALAPVSNWLQSVPGSDRVLENLFGIASQRSMPSFAPESFEAWFSERGGARIPADQASHRVVLYPDTYGNYSAPAVLKAGVLVLEAADVHITIPDDLGSSGRAAHSMGFLDTARDRAEANVATLLPRVERGYAVVAVEPSDAVMFQQDYRDLLGTNAASRVAANSYGFCEFLNRTELPSRVRWDAPAETLTYHGHCHQKAYTRDHHAVAVLRQAGFRVDPLDSGCCGMAGSFGYEAEHYSMSQAIGDILIEQVEASAGARMVAPGASCRTQLGDRTANDEPDHPAELLLEALAEP
jgi:FAD/FMN-containing dehydrogenase/Fe-S oxidoreductase